MPQQSSKKSTSSSSSSYSSSSSSSSMGASTKRTTHLSYPTKSDGTLDKRYTMPQFVKNDGRRDMRTILTSDRKCAQKQ